MIEAQVWVELQEARLGCFIGLNHVFGCNCSKPHLFAEDFDTGIWGQTIIVVIVVAMHVIGEKQSAWPTELKIGWLLTVVNHLIKPSATAVFQRFCISSDDWNFFTGRVAWLYFSHTPFWPSLLWNITKALERKDSTVQSSTQLQKTKDRHNRDESSGLEC